MATLLPNPNTRKWCSFLFWTSCNPSRFSVFFPASCSPWWRFVELDLPFSTIGLVWNSMMSVAGGWFFLMACEMFVLGDKDFRLPGLGSYLQTAASAGDTRSILWGVGTKIARA